jgi:hypothetical protein
VQKLSTTKKKRKRKLKCVTQIPKVLVLTNTKSFTNVNNEFVVRKHSDYTIFYGRNA